MTSHLTDSHATGQRHIHDEHSHVFVCAWDYENPLTLKEISLHAFVFTVWQCVLWVCVWIKKQNHSILMLWGPPFGPQASAPTRFLKGPGKTKYTQLATFFICSPTHYAATCVPESSIYSLAQSSCTERKNAKLIILVTLVYIHKHNLFLMKRGLMCGWVINMALREMLRCCRVLWRASDAWLAAF